MIQIESISFNYQDGPQVFDNFNWHVKRGEAWVILGPSGCGKSTLLYLIAGLSFPQSGSIKIVGRQISRPRPKSGLILQDYGLMPWATVNENVELGLRVRSFYGPDGKHAPAENQNPLSVNQWLERLRLSDQADKFPGQISGGQRQRTAIARTLVLNPDLLLMDEPFSSLDAPTREGLQMLTLELVSEQKLTLLLVTHSIEEAAFMGQKILLLNKPPNQNAEIIHNPSSGNAEYRESEQYSLMCKDLRHRMDQG
jgi:ABC-type nitrate/sulfonate/bicarbonate transport system ATPase subunit